MEPWFPPLLEQTLPDIIPTTRPFILLTKCLPLFKPVGVGFSVNYNRVLCYISPLAVLVPCPLLEASFSQGKKEERRKKERI